VTQTWLKDVCNAANADTALKIRGEEDYPPCWITAFESFVLANGGMFPTDRNISEALQAFMHNEDVTKLGYDEGAVTDGEDFAGRVNLVVFRFKINVGTTSSSDERREMREKWTDFVRKQNDQAPSSGVARILMVSSSWTTLELETQVLPSTLAAFAGSMVITGVAVSVFTGNVILATYVCINIMLVVCLLAGFLLNVQAYEFGVVEAIGATVFVGLSVDYCLHLTHAYSEAPGEDSAAKVKHALIFMGPSIMGGALTTIAGTAFLLPCKILLFQKLGWTLMSNAVFSLTLTFTFLVPMLIVAGPTGLIGTIYCFPIIQQLTKTLDKE